MGHLGGGTERDVCTSIHFTRHWYRPLVFQIAMLSKIQLPLWLAYTVIYSFVHCSPTIDPPQVLMKIWSDWADFNIPTPFGSRVRNALKAEACSVRLSNLVGAGGFWYGFGKTIMEMQVTPPTIAPTISYMLFSLSEDQANGISEMLTKVTNPHRQMTTAKIIWQGFSKSSPWGRGSSSTFCSTWSSWCWWFIG